MSNSTMFVDEKRYDLDEIRLSISRHEEGNNVGLIVNIFADSHDRQMPGIAINCIYIKDASSIERIEFFLDTHSDDNDLCESCLVEPNWTLELDSLRLKFGVIQDGHIKIKLEAICHTTNDVTYQVDRKNIRVAGDLLAKVVLKNNQND